MGSEEWMKTTSLDTRNVWARGNLRVWTLRIHHAFQSLILFAAIHGYHNRRGTYGVPPKANTCWSFSAHIQYQQSHENIGPKDIPISHLFPKGAPCRYQIYKKGDWQQPIYYKGRTTRMPICEGCLIIYCFRSMGSSTTFSPWSWSLLDFKGFLVDIILIAWINMTTAQWKKYGVSFCYWD